MKIVPGGDDLVIVSPASCSVGLVGRPNVSLFGLLRELDFVLLLLLKNERQLAVAIGICYVQNCVVPCVANCNLKHI